VRNTGMPAQVPLAGGTQALVHRLVTAALLLFAASTALSPALAHHAAPRAAHAISVPARPVGPAGGAQAIRDARPPQMVGEPEVAQAQPPEAQHPRAEKIYVVQPPAGRYHESLWEIAHNHLGDGRRYREIFELNSGRLQPDGSKLTIASLIRPGWVLRMPRDAFGPGIEVVATQSASPAPAGPEDASGAPAEQGHGAATGHGAAMARPGHGAATARPGHGAASARAGHGTAAGGAATASAGQGATARAGSGGSRSGAGAGARATHSAQASDGAATTSPAETGSAHPPGTGSSAAAASQGWPGPVYPAELAAASLLAAGVLAALGRRRREQLWRRAFGRRVVGPAEEAAMAEAALRLGADEPGTRVLDTGLRYLSYALAAAGVAPPSVFAAHLGGENLDL